MQATLSTISLTYEALFRTPFFRIADARPAVLEALYRAFAQYGVRPGDMFGFSGASLGEQRARINLFRGNAYIEVTAEKIVGNFSNAVGKEDIEIVENCIRKGLGAMEAYATEAQLGNEQITIYPKMEMESEEIRNTFLRSLPVPKTLPSFASSQNAKVWPSYRIELEHPEREWLIDVTVQRAWDSPKNLFVSAHGYFYTGASSEKVADRSKVLGDTLTSVLDCLGLERPSR